MALTLFQSLITRSKKRRISEREDFEEMFRTSQSNRREIEDEDSLAVAISCAAVATVSSRKSAAPRRPVINRQQQQLPGQKDTGIGASPWLPSTPYNFK